MLPHTQRIEELLRQGKLQEAMDQHNQYVDAQLELSKTGVPIDLSDLMAAKEQFHLNELGEFHADTNVP